MQDPSDTTACYNVAIYGSGSTGSVKTKPGFPDSVPTTGGEKPLPDQKPSSQVQSAGAKGQVNENPKEKCFQYDDDLLMGMARTEDEETARQRGSGAGFFPLLPTRTAMFYL